MISSDTPGTLKKDRNDSIISCRIDDPIVVPEQRDVLHDMTLEEVTEDQVKTEYSISHDDSHNDFVVYKRTDGMVLYIPNSEFRDMTLCTDFKLSDLESIPLQDIIDRHESEIDLREREAQDSLKRKQSNDTSTDGR